ncbi:hypothetical protein [Noviherbaspirillum malthae]|uniref:hypothetical protein n=1 Tax=Noviherbaspirillum malthae TaxID=1260987 RepID=UPI00188EA5C9|nr:hypothetical protein [Noviherbaspirillum malthae]
MIKKHFDWSRFVTRLRRTRLPFFAGDEDDCGCIQFDTLTAHVRLSVDPASNRMTPIEEFNGSKFVVRVPCTVFGHALAAIFASTELKRNYRRLRASAQVDYRNGDEVIVYDYDAAEALADLFGHLDGDLESCAQPYVVDDFLFGAGNSLTDYWNDQNLDDAVEETSALIDDCAKRNGFLPVGDVRSSLLQAARSAMEYGTLNPIHIHELQAAGVINEQQAAEWFEENA